MANSHKRDTNARRTTPKAVRIAAPLAVMATVSAVSLGVLVSDPAITTAVTQTAANDILIDRDDAPVTRSTSRTASGATAALDASLKAPDPLSKAAIAKAIKKAEKRLWTTDELNIWTAPGKTAEQLGELDAGKKVLVTGRELLGRVEVVLGGKSRWVTSGYLTEDKPLGLGAGLTMAPCPDPRCENGSIAAAVFVHRSVCPAFPEITTYGAWSNDGDHPSGQAIDIMTSDVALGPRSPTSCGPTTSELHLYYVIWRQHIWSRCAAPRDGAPCPPAARQPPTTTTTSTCRCTEPARSAVVPALS